MQTKLLFVGFSSEVWTNGEYIAGAGKCEINPQTVPRRPLHHKSDFIYHVKRDDWEEWGERQDDAEEFQNYSNSKSLIFSNEKLTEIYSEK